jgi:hypothetical protein
VARYRVVRWKRIPALVEAWDDEQRVRRPLSQRFQDLIDTVAMREGATDTEAYLDAWNEDADADRPGVAVSVADAIAAELEASFATYVHRYLGNE